ncbi:MAG: sulfotransferase [Tateyamaria sp.]|uniref:sulfotransferase n=1 Tax=Tateyamaria sp. TaxID=1929288 RepID=UPI00327FAD48
MIPSGTDKRARAQIDRRLAQDPAVGAEPRGDIYGRIKVHPDRFNLRSLPMETRVMAKSLLRNDKPKPFVIYGRPRSGTTLLVHLLDQVPQVRCDGELLRCLLMDPVGFLCRLPRRAGADLAAYGVKVISYHLLEVQRVRRPLAFFDKLAAQDYAVLHLTRNTWDQTLSLAKAHASAVYFSSKDPRHQKISIDPDRFLDLLRWNEAVIAYERKVMAYVPHLPIRYDIDLKSAGMHQPSIDRVCDFLGVPSGPVTAHFKRTGGKDGLHTTENSQELIRHVRGSELAHLVPDTLD